MTQSKTSLQKTSEKKSNDLQVLVETIVILEIDVIVGLVETPTVIGIRGESRQIIEVSGIGETVVTTAVVQEKIQTVIMTTIGPIL